MIYFVLKVNSEALLRPYYTTNMHEIIPSIANVMHQFENYHVIYFISNKE